MGFEPAAVSRLPRCASYARPVRKVLLLAVVVGLVVIAAAWWLSPGRSEEAYLACTTNRLADAPTVSGGDAPSMTLVLVAEVPQAVAVAQRPGSDSLFVAAKDGSVVVHDGSTRTVLDLSSEISTTWEQGLLGLAFSNDGQFVYVYYTDVDDDVQVAEYQVGADDSIDVATKRIVISVPQPYPTHNGGHLEMAADGTLLIGFGDGGFEDPSPNSAVGETAQDGTSLLGSIVRIDPRPSGGDSYAIPADNPHVGDDSVRDEILVTGLRNPWRFSLDEATGDLWIADVGHFCWEEVNHLPAATASANLGWPIAEGTHEFKGGDTEGLTFPVLELGEAEGYNVITGGRIYRGSEIPGLVGWYVFVDTYSGVFGAIRPAGDAYELIWLDLDAVQPTSFAETADGELLVASLRDGVFRLTPTDS